jgi:ornithine cyclodeaminase/alanine dehydrogenase-like protein (mu-crystallin family)
VLSGLAGTHALDQVTLFKSAVFALEDLAAAEAVLDRDRCKR